jgi:hypothetical protein
VLTEVVLTLTATRESGSAGTLETLTSVSSAPLTLRIRAPRPVENIVASFEAAERGSRYFSAAVEWHNGKEEAGNAQVVGHSVFRRRVTDLNTTCNATSGATAVGVAFTCTRAAGALSEYERVLTVESSVPKVTVGNLAVDGAFCFVAVARNALGDGQLGLTEACIDVSAMLRTKCEVGTELRDAAVFHCAKCSDGKYSAQEGAPCEPCKLAGEIGGQFTRATGATSCDICGEGTYGVDGGCTKCPLTRFLACRDGVLEWSPGGWYNVGEWSDEGAWVSENRVIDEETVVHACFNDFACSALDDGQDASALECVTDLGYHGPLCGSCVTPKFLRSGFACSVCPDDVAENYPLIVAMFFGIIAAVVYIGVFRSTRRRVGEIGGIIRRIGFSYMQMLGVLGIFKARGTKIFNEAIGKTSQIAG